MENSQFSGGSADSKLAGPFQDGMKIVIHRTATAVVLCPGGNSFTVPGGSSIVLSGGSATLSCGAVVCDNGGNGTTVTLGGGVFVLRDPGTLAAPTGANISVPSYFWGQRERKTFPLKAGTSISVVGAPSPRLDGVLRSASVLAQPWTVPAGGTIILEEIAVPYGNGSVIIGEGGCAAPAGSVVLGGPVMVASPGLAAGAIIPEKTTFGQATIFPQDTSLPGGTTFSGGIHFPEGTIFPGLTVFPAGTRFSAGVTLPDGQVVEKEEKKEEQRIMPWLR
ncbi:uncharacterized protein E0L32_006805 [Thyridium curvatum]|uniref:Uncharacterized protein n=1 Tax=Thyridium curvatum TaxID=1093900 RepID=A0A507AXM3_9PEZI|nr:uncharacterized protein E0L32_006805 [Thyridium curvatum]TPX12393.1 hypothetical protein E0L32_006805 [Thyridium curvatum]